MDTSTDREDRLAKSWETNADAWAKAVREQLIPSRKQATDAAIVKAVLDYHPRRVLDLGCGEGWLARKMSEVDIEVVGVDASAALIAAARERGGANYVLCSYSELASAPGIVGSAFDVIVSNFALLQEEVSPVLRAARSLLFPRGRLIIQTVHPWTAAGATYGDRWMEETFETISTDFVESMPWYFRTLESWSTILMQTGFVIGELREPRALGSTTPLSLIIAASARP